MTQGTRAERLFELDVWLCAAVARAFDLAYAIEEPAGTSDEWEAGLSYFGLLKISDKEREEIRAAQKPIRGAPVLEFRNMVVAIVEKSRASLRQITAFDAPTDVEILHTRLTRKLERTENELTEAYRRAVLPQRKGMFGNVFAHHDEGQKSQASAVAHALRCKHCGAPRLRDSDFTCAFCEEPMA